MARPRKGEEKKRPHHLGFRVSDEVRDALKAKAERLDVPMADIVHEALERDLGLRPAKKRGT